MKACDLAKKRVVLCHGTLMTDESDNSSKAANENLSFDGGQPPYKAGAEELVLEIDGYEGPIDILLSLARDQKVDLTKISILELAEQYLVFIAEARRLRIELAADYLIDLSIY